VLWRGFLQRLRNGLVTHDYWMRIATRSNTSLGEETWRALFEGKNARWFFCFNKDVLAHSIKVLKQNRAPIIVVKAEHTGPGAVNASAETAENLDSVLAVCSGAELMLLFNLWPEVGLSNGVYCTLICMIYAMMVLIIMIMEGSILWLQFVTFLAIMAQPFSLPWHSRLMIMAMRKW
jgi:hypothetical protein